MCGRFTLKAIPENLMAELGISAVPDPFTPRYNIAPSQIILAITNGKAPAFQYFRWGLIPFWAKDPKIGYRMINARSETLTTKKTFKGLIRKNRCLIVADGFYEWEKTGRRKVPYYILLKSEEPFAFAGLWSTWKDPEGKEVRSCTILTTGANDLVREIHDRMPVILDKKERVQWLAETMPDEAALAALCQPFNPQKMTQYEVSTRVNSPAHEDPGCVQPV